MKDRILVYNVGHNELYLSLRSTHHSLLARPLGFRLPEVAERLQQQAWQWQERTGEWSLVSPGLCQWTRAQLLERLELTSSEESLLASPELVGLQLPLLSAVVSQWMSRTQHTETHRLLLCCNSPVEGKAADSHTARVAEIAAAMLRLRWPSLEIANLEAKTDDPFAFDTSEQFVRELLVPKLSALRRPAVDRLGERWRDEIELSLAVASGTTPMVSALQRAVRSWHPVILHVPNARQKFKKDPPRVSVLDYRVLDLTPKLPRVGRAPEIEELCKQMEVWRDEFRPCWEHSEGELQTFWMRKGKKAVLAVLQLRRENGAYEYVRASNLEVSLPTGSLCAERNAIGTALAMRPNLRRRDLQRVAVLSLSEQNPLGPCGACQEWLGKIAEVNPDFEVLTFSSEKLDDVIIQRLEDF